LLDKEGHMVHIDFGFMLTNSPLKGISLENAPFKLTSDFVEVLGGEDSEGFRRFRKYF
jgi:phosphatidylinositol 4-kinase B